MYYLESNGDTGPQWEENFLVRRWVVLVMYLQGGPSLFCVVHPFCRHIGIYLQKCMQTSIGLIMLNPKVM